MLQIERKKRSVKKKCCGAARRRLAPGLESLLSSVHYTFSEVSWRRTVGGGGTSRWPDAWQRNWNIRFRANVASFYFLVRFSRVRATEGPYGGKKNSGAKKKKGGKHFTKRCSPLPGKQAEGERFGFSAPIIVTFGVTERIHWITDRQVSGTVISYFEWPVIRIVSERGITDRYRNRFDTERVHDVYTYVERKSGIDRLRV